MSSELPGCRDLVRLLADFLDGQLPTDVQESLQEHLSACPDCLTQLHTYRSTVDLLRSVTEEDLPAELRLTLKSFVESSGRN